MPAVDEPTIVARWTPEGTEICQSLGYPAGLLVILKVCDPGTT